MALEVSHGATVRTGVANYVVDLLDAGSGPALLKIQAGSKGGTTLATLTFSDPAFGAASGPTATADPITEEDTATAGTAAYFQAMDSDLNVVFAGSVGTGTHDIVISSTGIGEGDTVSISSLTYTAAP